MTGRLACLKSQATQSVIIGTSSVQFLLRSVSIYPSIGYTNSGVIRRTSATMYAPLSIPFPYSALFAECDVATRYDEAQVKYVVGSLLIGRSIFELAKDTGVTISYADMMAIRKSCTYQEYKKRFCRSHTFRFHSLAVDAGEDALAYLHSLVADAELSSDIRVEASKIITAVASKSAEALRQHHELTEIQNQLDELRGGG